MAEVTSWTMRLGARLAFVLLAATSAHGAAAPPNFQHYLAENHYGAVKTEGNGENHQFFDAKINGRDVHLLLDTGASLTGITRDCAERLGLTIKETGRVASGVDGSVGGTIGLARVASFTINNWEINHLSTVVVLPRYARMGGADGVCGFDTLALNAAIVSVAGEGFMIRPGQLGKGAAINEYMRMNGFASVPLTVTKNRILVTGTLNAKPLVAQIDSGASFSFFSLSYLRKMNVRMRWVPMRMQGIDGRTSSVQGFTPDEMTLGTYHAPQEMMAVQDVAMFDASPIDGVLGYEFLAERGAVIDTGSNTLWLK